MGKYIRKAKIPGEVAVMEVSHQSPLGVRTRARALAASAASAPSTDSSLAYLELRSRRLEKTMPSPPGASKLPPKEASGRKTINPNAKLNQRNDFGPADSISARRSSKTNEDAAPDVEVSFGDNVLESEARERYVRETTPCSLIRESETIRTPSSTTKPRNYTTNRVTQNFVHRNIPTSIEMEEFFASAEQFQQQTFIGKYNFDLVNETPLPGRYEWVRTKF